MLRVQDTHNELRSKYYKCLGTQCWFVMWSCCCRHIFGTSHGTTYRKCSLGRREGRLGSGHPLWPKNYLFIFNFSIFKVFRDLSKTKNKVEQDNSEVTNHEPVVGSKGSHSLYIFKCINIIINQHTNLYKNRHFVSEKWTEIWFYFNFNELIVMTGPPT